MKPSEERDEALDRDNVSSSNVKAMEIATALEIWG